MGGFRKAMPFTFGCMVIGGLALSGIPPFSGFFSKDEILTLLAARDDWHIVLAAIGYLGAFMTAVYTWRMIFRAFYGEPVEPARELEHGHLYHAPKHTNPATGEEEDTDVGFPGPEHHIAEREWSMKGAMSALAVLAIIGGVVQIPSVTNMLHDFLEPTFAGSRYYEDPRPVEHADLRRPFGRRADRPRGHRLAYRLWVAQPERPAAIRERFAGVHSFFVHKWYFDELIDLLIVRPVAWLGRFGRNVFERVVVNGVFVGGTAGAVRAGSAAVRARSPGSCATTPRCCARRDRPRPLLPDRRVVTIHLSILLFWPLALGLVAGLLPRGLARRGGARRRARPARLHGHHPARLRDGAGRAPVRHGRHLDRATWGSATSSASTGSTCGSSR